MGQVTEITSATFDAEITQYKGKVLIDFWAPWCGPCRMQGQIIEKLVAAEGFSGKVVKCNTDNSPDIAGRFGIQSIPTLILFENGKEIDRMVGVQTEQNLKSKFA